MVEFLVLVGRLIRLTKPRSFERAIYSAYGGMVAKTKRPSQGQQSSYVVHIGSLQSEDSARSCDRFLDASC